MLQEKLEQFVKIMEKQELEDSIQDPKLYHELFAAYLFLDDLVNARFLWKRIPVAVKNGNQELDHMHKIFLCLNRNDVVELYKLLDNYKWSKGVVEIMYELKEKVRMDTLDLIGHAYTSIFENVFGEMTSLSKDMIEDTCKRLNWEIQSGSYPRLIFPKKPVVEKVSALNAEDQLEKLTSIVSFLEN
ncbi:hypothetical protein PVAND_004420 [Polypedilum vanderplanki]|uniref:CSN8/PSMD8/EIF3K domain-containing protein n=1 Tax=Polypedilum vanderplanki TaxID=319348 RepID=A0A9J6BXI1_POLVA|nr:hypothetical protein PVAND_004420 [Polypedilum vanderplanki]